MGEHRNRSPGEEPPSVYRRWHERHLEESRSRQRFDDRVRDLEFGRRRETRAEAARRLREDGAAAVEPLCRALNDREAEVRCAAAESLGQISDERAVGPLLEALRRCFVGGSGRRQLVIGILVFGLMLLAVGAWLWANWVLKLGAVGFIGLIVHAFAFYFSRRHQQSQVCRSITSALAEIAEQNPKPELRQALPDLRAIAADTLQQERDTRRASQATARRIEELTDRLQGLPLPAEAPAPDAAALPRPSGPSEPDAKHLPRVRG